MNGQEKGLAEKGIYVSVSLAEESGEIILKAVNRNPEEQELNLLFAEGLAVRGSVRVWEISGRPEDFNSVQDPDRV